MNEWDELPTHLICQNCLKVQAERDQLRAENIRYKEALRTIGELHNSGHYIEGEPGHENHGCLASDIAKQALEGEGK